MMIPLWRRPEIVIMFINSMRDTLPDYAELIPLFVLSPEDPSIDSLNAMTKDYDRFYYKNHPLGEKKNAGLQYAVNNIEFDYYMDINSDSLWTEALWKWYKEYFESKNPYFGMKNIYILNILDNIANFLEGYHVDVHDEPTALGPGRCLRRDIVMENLPLWRSDWPAGMDGCSHYKLTKAGVECTVIDNARVPVLLDIKTLTNINLHFELDRPETRVDPNWVRAAFGISVYQSHCSDFRGHDDFEVFHTTVLKESNDTPTKRDAFNSVNIKYEIETGKRLYKNYNTYLATVSRKHRKP